MESFLDENIIDYYVFLQHMKAGTGAPLNMKIDLRKEMADLRDYNFTTMFEAEVALHDVFIRNRDAHTIWGMDAAFQLLSFLHPIAISSSIESGVQEFKVEHTTITSSLFSTYNATYPSQAIDFDSLDGKRIVSMNDKSPETFLKDLCTMYGFSRDNGTCLNELLRDERSTTFPFRLLSQMTYPREPIEYVLEDPISKETQNVTVDFLSCFMDGSTGLCQNITDLDTLKTLLGFSTGRRNDENEDISSNSSPYLMNIEDLMNERGKRKIRTLLGVETDEQAKEFAAKFHPPQQQQQQSDERRASDSITVACVDSTSMFLVYSFNDFPDIGIIKMTSFSHSLEVNELCTCFLNISQYEKIVFDLRDNGGGSIFLGMTLVKAFLKKTVPDYWDMLGPVLVDKTYTYPYPQYMDYLSNAPDARFQEIDGSVSKFKPYGKMILPESSRWNDIFTCSGYQGIEPEDLLIITDGSCGSTCGMFTKSLMAMEGAKVLTYGGFFNEEMDVTSFDGASVIDYYASPLYFSFSWAAMFNFDHDGMYDRSKYDLTKLLGYEFTPADFRNYNWTHLEKVDHSLVYHAIQNELQACVSWNIKIDPSCPSSGTIDHGIYGRPCGIDGTFNMTADCVLKRCEDGYYMNPQRTKCIAIEEAPMWQIFDEMYGNSANTMMFAGSLYLMMICFLVLM